MHILENLLSPGRVRCAVPELSFKRLFETIADLIHQDCEHIPTNTIVTNLYAREKLGSTGLGGGIAIPHSRVEGLSAPIGCLITLEEGVDFNAQDNKPVDIVFSLLVPSEACDEHLQILATLAGLFVQSEFCSKVRAATNAEALYDYVIHCEGDVQP